MIHMQRSQKLIFDQPYNKMPTHDQSAKAVHMVHLQFYYFAPLPNKTTLTVIRIILISSQKEELSIYCISSFTTSSKSLISLRPLTYHNPVKPGIIEPRALCAGKYFSEVSSLLSSYHLLIH